MGDLKFKIDDKTQVGTRLDAYLKQKIPGSSRAQIQKWIGTGHVLVGGKAVKASYLLHWDDEIHLAPPEQRTPDTKASCSSLKDKIRIVFEDDALLVVHKEPSVVVHGSESYKGPTLTGYLEELKIPLAQDRSAPLRPGVVHRLDKDTSGLLVLAKTEPAMRLLKQQFKDKSAGREYLALLNGILQKPRIDIESYLTRHPGQRTQFVSIPKETYLRLSPDEKEKKKYRLARSIFTELAQFAHRLSLVKVVLHSGRTHQIRVHAKALGSSVLGDPVYGNMNQLPKVFSGELRSLLQENKRQLLHAEKLSFTHPLTQKALTFTSPAPHDFVTILNLLKQFQNR